MSTQPARPAPTGRIVELDSLRALAAINLVLFHFTHVYAVKYGYTSPLGFEFPFGKYGVQLFFMLSGLVNAMTLTRKRNSSDFLAARIIRIFPSYWAVVAINVLIAGLAPLMLNWSTADILANLTIVPNLFGRECMEPVTWTLQVEVLFYGIILVLFASGALERPARTIAWLLTLSLMMCLSLQYLNSIGVEGVMSRWMLWSRELLILEYLPLFTIGIALNDIRNRPGSRLPNVLAIIASAVTFHVIDRHGHNPVATVMMVGLLTAALYRKAPFLRFGPLVWVSSISYALYLLHNNAGCVVIWYLNQAGLPPLAAMIAGILFAFGLAAVVTYRIEGPLTRWMRGRWNACRAKNKTVPNAIPVAAAVHSDNSSPGGTLP